MIKPPVVYVAGMLRQTGTYITTDDWVWMLDQMGQRPFYPPNVSGWEQNEAWLSTSALRMRFQAAASLLHDAIKDGEIPQKRTPEQALERSLAYAGRALDEQGDELRARLLQPAQRRRPGREVGGQALLARARARAAPGAARRPRRTGLLMPRGCSDWHGTRAALRGGGGRLVPIPERALDGLAEFERRGRALAARPARGRRRAAGRRQRRARPLDARRAGGGRGAGRRRAGRADPRLALPGRRQRRPQHARPARRPALRAAALAHRRRSRRPRCRSATRPASAGTPAWPGCASSTTPARWRCCPRSTTGTPISRTSTPAATGAAASSGPRPTAPAGWGARST